MMLYPTCIFLSCNSQFTGNWGGSWPSITAIAQYPHRPAAERSEGGEAGAKCKPVPNPVIWPGLWAC